MDRTTMQHWKNFVKNVIGGRKLYSAYKFQVCEVAVKNNVTLFRTTTTQNWVGK